MNVFLETPRLRLRDKRMDDLDFLADLSADPRVMRWIGDGRTYPRDEIEARLHRTLTIANAPGHPRWDAFLILERKADGERVGQAGMLRCVIDGVPDVEIGWWLAPGAWGNGYATEAAMALRDHAFGEVGLDRLAIVLHAENLPSVAVARRIGGAYAGMVTYREKWVTCYVVRRS